MPRRLNLSKEFLVFLSAFLFALSFPKFNLGFLIWFAFIPVFTAVRKAESYLEAFFLLFFVGFIFNFISLEWLRHVSPFGLFFISTCAAFYFGCFGLAVYFFMKKDPFYTGIFALPAIWAVLEWIRTEIPTWAFGWNLLAYSQTNHLPIARFANVLGAYGVSFLIVFVNFALWLFLNSFSNVQKRNKSVWRLLYAVLFLLLVYQHGLLIPKFKEPIHEISISVVQGNIPQSEKWDPAIKKETVQSYQSLSEFAAANHSDLIIWPEAAWPGVFNSDPDVKEFLKFVKKIKTPFLIGTLYEEEVPGMIRSRIYNSSYLINEKGEIGLRYDKIRLVPFGEFIPLERFFSIFGLEKFAYSLGVGDFSPGNHYQVFEFGKPSVRFSTLICFEDVFPSLARRFVKDGAQFMVVITNDAWFGKSAASYQHLQASIFRAIETGVPVVRATNTGVSGFISPRGKVMGRIQDKEGNDTWIMGGLTYPLDLRTFTTFYSKIGYFFPVLCLLAASGAFLFCLFFRSKTNFSE